MILDNQIIVDLLDETGLRRAKLAECLFSFQASYIDPLCGTLGIEPITLDANLNVAVGKISYAMLSDSEKFRVRTVLQLAVATMEHADLVIIDGADILDQGSRGKLLKTVLSTGIPAIICMTLNKPDMAPNLSAAGAGITYWVEGGTCKPTEIFKPVAASAVTEPSRPQEHDDTRAAAKGFYQGVREKRDGVTAQ